LEYVPLLAGSGNIYPYAKADPVASRESQRTALSRGRGLDERVLAFSHELFAHTDEHRGLNQRMMGGRSGAVIQQILYKMLVDLIRDDVKAEAPRGEAGSVPTEALAQLIAGSLFGLLKWWVDEKRRMSVEEVDTVFRRFAISALKATLRER